MSNPRNEIYDIAEDCNSIFEAFDVIDREYGDAIAEYDEIWFLKGITIQDTGVEYTLENRDREVKKDFAMHPTVVSPDLVECPICNEACKHSYSENIVRCKNDGCSMLEFDAKKYLYSES